MTRSFLLALFALSASAFSQADPRLTSWITAYSGKYARIVETDADLLANNTKTTWSRNNIAQTLPAYVGVQEVSSSAAFVYIRTTGLGIHTMGPWYDNAAKSALFVNIPKNQKVIYRVPRTPVAATTKVNVGGGDCGYFVDGVTMFDARDAVSYSNASARDGDAPGTPNGVNGDGIWNRDAYMNEAITFDPALAHQQNTGVYHYHANPIATRFLLGDHIDFNPTTKRYSESTAAVTKHSPIVAWAKDGYPIYGPYGYATATDATSGLRRMVCGFVPRNGTNGTTNLATTGRTTLPAWAARTQGRSATLTSGQYGPAVSTSFALGRYTEDNDYLGDLGKTQGVDFDLDQYNGRTCVTPEFPNGTYAYFVAITAAGTPTYPYNLGRQYYGTPSGGAVVSITETVTTNFNVGPNTQEQMGSPAVSGGNVALAWSSVEGGTYKLEATNDLSTAWSTVSSTVAASPGVATGFTETGGATGRTQRFYRVTRTALATYDPVASTTSTSSGILSVSPTSAARGATITLTINLDSSVNPPPQQAPVNSVSIGTISSTSRTHVSQTKVTAVFTIPANATTGPQTVSVVFPGPPDDPSASVTYSLANAFTVTSGAGLTATRTLKKTPAR